MNLEKIFDQTIPYSQIEDIILTNLEVAENEQEICSMTADFLLNTLNLSGKKPEESAVMLATLFELSESAFATVVTFSYYLASLEFWTYLNEQDLQLEDVIANVKSEVVRCQDVTGAFLTKMLPEESYARQLQIFRKNFTISDQFQDVLGTYVSGFQKGIIQVILEKLAQ